MTRPVPTPDISTALFWEAANDHRLVLPTCGSCNARFFPPLPTCPECSAHDWKWLAVPQRGTVYSWTVIHRSGHPYWRNRTPYAVLMVELDVPGAPRLVGGLVGSEPATLRGGEIVEAVFESVEPSSTLIQWQVVA
jgi:uncharacterized OB-fold protein